MDNTKTITDTLPTRNDWEGRCKALEARLRQAQRTEVFGRLVGGVVHDFNNLLTVLLGYSEFVVTDVNQGDPLLGPLTEIHKTAQRAAQLAQRLLRFSRARSPALQPLDLNQVLRDMDAMLRRIINGMISHSLVATPDLDLINADLGQVEQIILNLALNARDAMPHGGKLVLHTANVQLPGSQTHGGFWRLPPTGPGCYVMLAITDSGCGMDEHTQAQIFEPFFTTKGPGQGTGLGLASVEELVREHDGCIWLASEVGKGTTFRIFFPRLRIPEINNRTNHSLAEHLRGWETVLLVEEDEGIRALTRQVLQNSGYHVLVAESPSEGLDFCRQEPGTIHLLIADILAVKPTSRNLASRVLQVRPDLRILLLSHSADDTPTGPGPGLSAHSSGVLAKPFTPTSLLGKVREVLDS